MPLPTPPTVSKAFGAASILIGQSTSLTFTVTNPNPTFTTLTNLSFADSLPGGLVVASPNGLVNTCGGNINASRRVDLHLHGHGDFGPGSVVHVEDQRQRDLGGHQGQRDRRHFVHPERSRRHAVRIDQRAAAHAAHGEQGVRRGQHRRSASRRR